MNTCKLMRCCIGIIACAMAWGCVNYYKVTDPTTGRIYYTQNLLRQDGSVKLTDARTGNQVTLQNSELEQITEQQFKAAKAGTANQP